MSRNYVANLVCDFALTVGTNVASCSTILSFGYAKQHGNNTILFPEFRVTFLLVAHNTIA